MDYDETGEVSTDDFIPYLDILWYLGDLIVYRRQQNDSPRTKTLQSQESNILF